MRLTGVELRRLLARRMVRLLLAAGFLGIVVALVVAGVVSSRNIAAARARAEAEAATLATPPPPLVQVCADKLGQSVTVVPENPTGSGPGVNGPCNYSAPPATDFFVDPRFDFAKQALTILAAVVAFAAFIGFVVAASFVGAEWGAGTFGLLLMWEPRRLRVLAAKLLAPVLVFVVVGALGLLLSLGGAWAVAATRGTLAGTTHHLVHTMVFQGLRGLVLIALMTAAGAAIAGVTRFTPAATAALIAYLIGGEAILRHLEPGWTRWLLSTNAAALLSGKAFVPRVAEFATPGLLAPEKPFFLHAGRAAVYLIVLMALLVALWAVNLLRRDVE